MFITECRYLHSRAEDDRSKRALRFYHNIDGEALRATLKQLDQSTSEIQRVGLISVWKDRAARRGNTCRCSCGNLDGDDVIAAINAFSFEILLSTGLSVEQASIGNIAICMMSVTGILFSSLIIDRFGRRTLLLSTYSLLAVINLVIAGLMFGFQRGQLSCILLTFQRNSLFRAFHSVILSWQQSACSISYLPQDQVQWPYSSLANLSTKMPERASVLGYLFEVARVYVLSFCCTSFYRKPKEEHHRKYKIVGEIYRQLAKEDGGDLPLSQYTVHEHDSR
ncbi:hypothetical protein OSTOST_11752 [Ostertagia ostertagi]